MFGFKNASDLEASLVLVCQILSVAVFTAKLKLQLGSEDFSVAISYLALPLSIYLVVGALTFVVCSDFSIRSAGFGLFSVSKKSPGTTKIVFEGSTDQESKYNLPEPKQLFSLYKAEYYFSLHKSRFRYFANDGIIYATILAPLVILSSLSTDLLSSGFQSTNMNFLNQQLLVLNLSISHSLYILYTYTFSQSLHMATSTNSKMFYYTGILLSQYLYWILCCASLGSNFFSLVFSVAILHTSITLLADSLHNSFTFAEVTTLTQVFMLCAYDYIFEVFFKIFDSDGYIIKTVLESIFIGAAVMMILVYLQTFSKSRTLKLPAVLFGIPFTLTALFINTAFKLKTAYSPIIWILSFVLRKMENLLIVVYCATVLIASYLLYAFAPDLFRYSNSKFLLYLRRKCYHLLAILLIVPPLHTSPNTTSLALGFAFFAMFLSECLRVLKIGAIATYINSFYSSVTDEKDGGKVIMSHIYLLFGCSFSIWLEGSVSIQSLSGILTIGVADAVASIVGTKFGKNRWFQSNKTVEGTLGFISSLAASCFLVDFAAAELPSYLQSYRILIILLISTLTGVLEAVTLQNDNLVLTLVFYGLSKILL